MASIDIPTTSNPYGAWHQSGTKQGKKGRARRRSKNGHNGAPVERAQRVVDNITAENNKNKQQVFEALKMLEYDMEIIKDAYSIVLSKNTGTFEHLIQSNVTL